jgi:hypothetical protein
MVNLIKIRRLFDWASSEEHEDNEQKSGGEQTGMVRVAAAAKTETENSFILQM